MKYGLKLFVRVILQFKIHHTLLWKKKRKKKSFYLSCESELPCCL